MRIDPRQPIHWNNDPNLPAGTFWQADMNGHMRNDVFADGPAYGRFSPTARKTMKLRNFLMIAIPMAIVMLSVLIYQFASMMMA